MSQTACFKAFQPPMLGSSSHVYPIHKILLFRHLYFVVTHTTYIGVTQTYIHGVSHNNFSLIAETNDISDKKQHSTFA